MKRIISITMIIAMIFVMSAMLVSADTTYVAEHDESFLYGIPAGTTRTDAVKAFPADFVVYDTNVAAGDKVPTGAEFSINGFDLTAVVLGDVIADGVVNAQDYFEVKKYYFGVSTETYTDAKLAAMQADENGDIRAIHYFVIKSSVLAGYDLNAQYADTLPDYDAGWTADWA